jgi:hypothetical protein
MKKPFTNMEPSQNQKTIFQTFRFYRSKILVEKLFFDISTLRKMFSNSKTKNHKKIF